MMRPTGNCNAASSNVQPDGQVTQDLSLTVQGTWSDVPTSDDEYYIHWIMDSGLPGGHVASVVAWQSCGEACDTTLAHACLIALAPQLRDALASLLEWESQTGGWEAACWRRARALMSTLQEPTIGGNRSEPTIHHNDGDAP